MISSDDPVIIISSLLQYKVRIKRELFLLLVHNTSNPAPTTELYNWGIKCIRCQISTLTSQLDPWHSQPTAELWTLLSYFFVLCPSPLAFSHIHSTFWACWFSVRDKWEKEKKVKQKQKQNHTHTQESIHTLSFFLRFLLQILSWWLKFHAESFNSDCSYFDQNVQSLSYLLKFWADCSHFNLTSSCKLIVQISSWLYNSKLKLKKKFKQNF